MKIFVYRILPVIHRPCKVIYLKIVLPERKTLQVGYLCKTDRQQFHDTIE